MRTIAATVLAAILGAGCYQVHVRTTARLGDYEEEETTMHFVNGLTPATIRASDCPNGVARVSFKLPWWNFLLSSVTFGIVSAAQTTWVCSEGRGKGGRSSDAGSGAPTPVADAKPVATAAPAP